MSSGVGRCRQRPVFPIRARGGELYGIPYTTLHPTAMMRRLKCKTAAAQARQVHRKCPARERHGVDVTIISRSRFGQMVVCAGRLPKSVSLYSEARHT
jgi:hypothetical protein